MVNHYVDKVTGFHYLRCSWFDLHLSNTDLFNDYCSKQRTCTCFGGPVIFTGVGIGKIRGGIFINLREETEA